MIRTAFSITPVVSQRSWQIWSVKEGASDLICSDCPAVLTWGTPFAPNFSPGLQHANTVLTVPIHKRAALVGVQHSQAELHMIGDKQVAQLNSTTGMFSDQIYCPAEDFIWKKEDGTIGKRKDLLAERSDQNETQS